MQNREFRTSQLVALVAVFAALNIITDSLPSLPVFPSGVWYSWNFLIVPLTGILLGPVLGFVATFIGVMVGHYIYFIDAFELLFTIGAPIGAAISVLIFRGKWKLVLVYYITLFTAYFITPIAWQLPIWGMWDTYLAFAFLLTAIFLIEKGAWKYDRKGLPLTLVISAFIGLEADVLFRIFLFIPGQTYRLFYPFNVETLQVIWVGGAILTPIKVALSTLATVIIGYPLIQTLRKIAY
ncbi:MAG: hypothetical protein JSV51_09145 [Candidatus Bathyarchaeota archaeon]|nr:MAG: hypothetical protein JSV51_09145 [Candidatus Bathyarchaeota archaeon]